MEKLEAALAKHAAALKTFDNFYAEGSKGKLHLAMVASFKEVESALAEAKAAPAPQPTTV